MSRPIRVCNPYEVWLFVGSSTLFTCAFLGILVWAGVPREETVVWLVAVLLCAAFALLMWWVGPRSTLDIDDEGVTFNSDLSRRTRLVWDEIQEIKILEVPMAGRALAFTAGGDMLRCEAARFRALDSRLPRNRRWLDELHQSVTARWLAHRSAG